MVGDRGCLWVLVLDLLAQYIVRVLGASERARVLMSSADLIWLLVRATKRARLLLCVWIGR